MSSIRVTKNDFANLGVEKGSNEFIKITCERVRSQAALLAPVDTGQLANSLMWKVKSEEGGFNEAQRGQGLTASEGDKLSIRPGDKEGFVGTNIQHGVYQEFGTRYQPAQPFLRPAGEAVLLDASLNQIVKKFGQSAMTKEFAKRKTKTTEI